MDWYYAKEQQQMGPVSEMELRNLWESGQIADGTLIWNESMPDWAPISTVLTARETPPPAAAVAGAPAGSGFPAPGDPNNPYAPGQSTYGAPQAVVPGGTGVGDLENPNVRVLSAIERSFKLMFSSQENFFLILGVFLTWGLLVIVSALPLGFFWAWLPLQAGAIWFTLQLIRGRAASFGDLFEGFRRNFAQLVLLNLIYAGIYFVFFGIVFGITFGLAISMDLGDAEMELVSQVVQLIANIPQAIFMSLSIFAIPLCIDRNYSCTGALAMSFRIASKKFWPILGLMLLTGLLSMAGALACLIGLLVTVPVRHIAFAYLYEDVFGDPGPDQWD